MVYCQVTSACKRFAHHGVHHTYILTHAVKMAPEMCVSWRNSYILIHTVRFTNLNLTQSSALPRSYHLPRNHLLVCLHPSVACRVQPNVSVPLVASVSYGVDGNGCRGHSCLLLGVSKDQVSHRTSPAVEYLMALWAVVVTVIVPFSRLPINTHLIVSIMMI